MNGKVINNLRRNVKPIMTRPLSSFAKTLLMLMAAGILFPLQMFSQANDTTIVAESKASTLKYLKSEALLEQEKRQNKIFIDQFEIDLSVHKEAIVLVKTRIKNSPDVDNGHNVANVNMGSVVKVYKYFRKDKSYAVKYNNKWGFLPASMIQEL